MREAQACWRQRRWAVLMSCDALEQFGVELGPMVNAGVQRSRKRCGGDSAPREEYELPDHANSNTSWLSRFAAISQYFSSISIPMAWRFMSLAATQVVPVPQNGSITKACSVLPIK